MAKRPDNLTYAVDDLPPAGQLILLGLQQVCLIAIYLVIAVIVVRAAQAPHAVAQSAVSWGMIALGTAAVLQAVWKGPIGSGYLAPSVLSAIYLQPSLLAVSLGGLPLVFGMTICAGLFEMALSRVLHVMRAIFPPLVCGFIVMAVGIELGLIGTRQLLDVKEIDTGGFPLHVAVSVFTLVSMVGLSIWARGMARLLAALIGILLGWVVAFSCGLIPTPAMQAVREAALFGLPRVDYLSYSFSPQLLVPFLIAGLAAALRTIGVITTCQRINDAEWKRPFMPSIERGVLADGLGCVIGGALGVVGMSSSPSSVGISQASGATSRYIALALGGWFVLLACMPKLTAVFMALPQAVVGAALVFTGSMMLVSGIQILASRPLDLRKTFVVGISLLLGLSHEVFPSYFAALPHWLSVMTNTLLSIATISAVLLNALFRLGIRRSLTTTIEVGTVDAEGFKKLVRHDTTGWGAGTEVVERATAVAASVVQLLQDGHLADGPVTIRISYDELNFDVDLSYSGELLHLPVRRPPTEEDMLEEMPMARGLAGFLFGVYPDRVRYSANNTDCHIRLSFGV